MATKTLFAGTTLAVVAIMGATALLAGEGVGGGPNALGASVADFTLKTPAGKAIAFSEFRKDDEGKAVPVVVTFWSYKCPSGRGPWGASRRIFGAKIVTAACVVDREGKIACRGGLGESKPEAAVAEIAAGKPVTKAETRGFG